MKANPSVWLRTLRQAWSRCMKQQKRCGAVSVTPRVHYFILVFIYSNAAAREEELISCSWCQNMSITLIGARAAQRNSSHQRSEEYQTALHRLVRGRDLVMPITTNHNQKSIFSHSLLVRSVLIGSDRFVFPEMASAFMKTT